MPAQLPLIPIIPIDSGEARKLDISIALQKIYYQPSGYQRTVKKLFEASQKAEFNFTIDEVRDWLERQAVHQIHKPQPKFIQYASFNNIQFLNEVHQSDTTLMPHDKVGNQIYKYRGVIKDIATRYRRSFALTDKSSAQMAKAIQKFIMILMILLTKVACLNLLKIPRLVSARFYYNFIIISAEFWQFWHL